MAEANPLEVLGRIVREADLVAPGSRGVVLVSGGADSAATAAGLVEALGAGEVVGLHLNYGLRPDSDRDQGTCGELCAMLGIGLEVERPELGSGNVQAEARESAMRRPSGYGALRGSTGSPPATRGRTWPRRCSTGSRPPPAAARCWGSGPAVGRSCGRSSRSTGIRRDGW